MSLKQSKSIIANSNNDKINKINYIFESYGNFKKKFTLYIETLIKNEL